MRLLEEIDPKLNVSSSISYARKDTAGELPKKSKWKHVGIDYVLSFSDLKKNYDAIGSFLHTPTLFQSQNNLALSTAEIRIRCENVLKILEKVLSSTVWNFTLGQYITFECLRCKRQIRRRMPHGKNKIDIRCFECNAGYCAGEATDEKSFSWTPNRQLIKCLNATCCGEYELWDDKISEGYNWKCNNCKTKHIIIYSIEVAG